ncbi:MAG TPA: glycosyltransferase family 9 protein, partial [Candidatus Sulfotelmatobacter sp.]|nr:glycosyltransferase family 9 protein [Candidatus Sulfotelmatobacter sp.]
LRALRRARRDAHIALVGLAVNRPLVNRFSAYIDELIVFPGYPGLPEQPFDEAAFTQFRIRTRERSFDLALQLHGSGPASNGLTIAIGARINAGFHLPEEPCPDADTFLPYSDDESEVLRPLRLLSHLGIEARDAALEFPIEPEDEEEIDELLGSSGFGETSFACIHPGAAEPSKRWPAERFALVGRALAREGLRVAVTGVDKESRLTSEVGRSIGHAAIDLGGRCSLGGLAVLLRRSRLLVCNDTGVSHLAAAVRVPSVVVASSPNTSRWAPLDGRLHHVVAQAGAAPVAAAAVLAEAKRLFAPLTTARTSPAKA